MVEVQSATQEEPFDPEDLEEYDSEDDHGHGNEAGDEVPSVGSNDYGAKEARNFPPKVSTWTSADKTNHPNVGFNMGKKYSWRKVQEEVNHFRSKVGVGNDGVEELFNILYGEDSQLFAKWKEICNKSFEEFSLFMATFYLKCRFSITYQELYDDDLVDTSSYLDPKRYKELWTMIDEYHKYDDFSKRAWQEVESALNTVMQDLGIPKGGQFKMHVTVDDDKHWFAFGRRPRDVPLDENSTLQRSRHVRDNATGMTADVTMYTGSGFVIYITPLILQSNTPSTSLVVGLSHVV